MSEISVSEQLKQELLAEATRQHCDVETLLMRALHPATDDNLRRFFELSLDLLCITQDGMFIRVNPALSKMLGYDEHTLLTTPYIEFICPADRETTSRVVEDGLNGSLLLYFENRMITKDNREVWIAWTSMPDYQSGLVFSVGRDISAQKQQAELHEQRNAQNASMLEALVEARTHELSDTIRRLEEEIQRREALESAKKQYEDSLRVSEARFRGAFEFSAIGMALVSPEGKWLRVNQAMTRILGYTQDELQQIDYQRITHPEDLEPDLQLVQAALRGEIEHFQMQKRYNHKNGKLVWAQLAVSLVRDVDGQPSYFVSQVQDITEQKQAEEAQLRANEEMQRFAYIMSHDLRAPLINLRGFSEILRKSVDEINALSDGIAPCLNEDQKKSLTKLLEEKMPVALKFIGTSVDRMDQYTEAMLKLSRIGRRQLRFESVCSRTIVERILQSLAAQITEQGIQVETGELPVIVADRLALDQIFSNIVINAVKYLDPARRGRIRIHSEPRETEIVFHVSDNGRGIKESDQSRIFEPFHRVTTTPTEGEGMGLAYVKALVKRHSGRIWFVSQPGEGSTFSFSLPNRQEVTAESDEAGLESGTVLDRKGL